MFTATGSDVKNFSEQRHRWYLLSAVSSINNLFVHDNSASGIDDRMIVYRRIRILVRHGFS